MTLRLDAPDHARDVGGHGNENRESAANGLVQRRLASIDDPPIQESERMYRWPLGRRQDDHPELTELGP